MTQVSDMKLRVWNYANGDDFQVRFEKPGSRWPAFDLFLYQDRGMLIATLGDLTAQVSGSELLEIMEIVQRRQAGEIFQYG